MFSSLKLQILLFVKTIQEVIKFQKLHNFHNKMQVLEIPSELQAPNSLFFIRHDFSFDLSDGTAKCA